MFSSLLLAVTFSSIVPLASSCCLEWIWPGSQEAKNTTADAAKTTSNNLAECDIMEVITKVDDAGQVLLQDIVDVVNPLGVLHPPAGSAPPQPSGGAEGAESGGTNKKDTIPGGPASGG